jgi:hypothetical protein
MSVDARTRGAERQRGPGQLRIVVQPATIREKWHAPGYLLQTLLPFLCGPTITLRVSRPFFQLSPATAADRHVWDVKWNLSSLSFPFLFLLFKNSAPGAKQLPGGEPESFGD